MTEFNLKKYDIEFPSKGKFIIILVSKWCKSCKLLSKILKYFRDEGIIDLKEIDIAQNSLLAKDLNINAIPALIFFKDGKLLDKDLDLYGEKLVKRGVLIGSFNEDLLYEIIKKM